MNYSPIDIEAELESIAKIQKIREAKQKAVIEKIDKPKSETLTLKLTKEDKAQIKKLCKLNAFDITPEQLVYLMVSSSLEEMEDLLLYNAD